MATSGLALAPDVRRRPLCRISAAGRCHCRSAIPAPGATAARRQTEPAVLAANSSGAGQPDACEPARWGFSLQRGLMLLVAGVALGALVGLWVQRVR